MTRIHLPALLAALMLCDAAAAAIAVPLSRVERGNLIFENIPAAAAGSSEVLDGYLNARQATPLGFSPKGQLLIRTRFGESDQLHLVEAPAGARRQLTFLREPVRQAAFSPDPFHSAFVYAEDTGGDENAQLYYQRLGEGMARRVSDGKSMNGKPVWSNAGRELAFFSTARDGVSYDIYIAEPESGSLPRLAVTGDGGAWYPLDWSPDDRKLLVLKCVSISEAYLYVVDLSSGQKHEVDPAQAKVRIAGAKFSRDGQGVYFISDRDAEFLQLRYANIFTDEKSIISAHLAWDVEELAVSSDGHYLAYVSNEAGIGKLNVLDLRTHQDLNPPKLPESGSVDSLSFDALGNRLAFGLAAPNRPRDAYVLDIEANRAEAWTSSEAGAADLAKFVTPRLAQFPTFDRADGRARQVPVYVYEPSKAGPHPVLIVLHGGPPSQFRPGFDPWLQYLVNELGFAVVAPNVRGSSGYGKSYAALARGMLREDAVKDMGALLVWLGLQSTLDAKHVVVIGAGDGGYLALATLVNFSERLRGGVDVAGVSDFLSYLTDIAPFRQNRGRAEFGDERDPDARAYLRRISPVTNAERITRPLLVVHGRNDPQVPLDQAQQIVNRLRARGGDVWYLQANDEGHEFLKKSNVDAYYRTLAQFLTSLGP
jgi:dipeptidyl aminopeptidase/acylaminoacyl peptidase